MSMVTISENGQLRQHRPTWQHNRPANGCFGYDSPQLEMLESIRNVLEQIQRSQMLSCDVRRDIAEIRRSLQRRHIEETAAWLEVQARSCARKGDQQQATFYRAAAIRLRRRRVK